MRPGRSIALLCLLSVAAFAPVGPALAQTAPATTTVVPPVNPQGDELDGGVTAPPVATSPGIAPDDAQALPPASTTEAPAATAAGATPTPPPYLAPGPDAQVQPVSSVATLTTPEIPAEPLRIAALVAALLAALLVGAATLVRALGLRSVGAPVVPEPSADSGSLRLRERVSTVFDDVRDFLRHSR